MMTIKNDSQERRPCTVMVKEVRKRRTVRVCRPTDRSDVYAHVGQHGALHEPEVRFALQTRDGAVERDEDAHLREEQRVFLCL